MKKQGIYKLENLENGNIYIGQSSDIDNRENWHKRDLIENKHHQKNLQREFNERVELEKELIKDNKYISYINYKSYVFDTVYKMIPLKLIDNYDKEIILNIEDEYILKYRIFQKGYEQMTNKEIKDKYEHKGKEFEEENKIKHEQYLIKKKQEIQKKIVKQQLKECVSSVDGIAFKTLDRNIKITEDNVKLEINTDTFDVYKNNFDEQLVSLFYLYIKGKRKHQKSDAFKITCYVRNIIDFSVQFNKYTSILNFEDNDKPIFTEKIVRNLLSYFKNSIQIINEEVFGNTNVITYSIDLIIFEKEVFAYYKNAIEKYFNKNYLETKEISLVKLEGDK